MWDFRQNLTLGMIDISESRLESEVVVLFCFLRAIPTTYGGSQARDPIEAIATGLRQSHSNVRSEPCLRPTPQLTAMPDP